MREITYLIYIILWEGLIFGGVGYAVFILGHSGWWVLAALLVGGCAYTPERWMDGQKCEESKLISTLNKYFETRDSIEKKVKEVI